MFLMLCKEKLKSALKISLLKNEHFLKMMDNLGEFYGIKKNKDSEKD